MNQPMEILAPWAGGRVGLVSRKGLGRKPGRKRLGSFWKGSAEGPGEASGPLGTGHWPPPHRWGILGTSWHMPGHGGGGGRPGKEVLAAPQQASRVGGCGQRGEGGMNLGEVP